MNHLATQIMQRIKELALISEEPGQLTRTFCSAAMRRANKLVSGWMREAGLTVRQDAIGNLIGYYCGHIPTSDAHKLRAGAESPIAEKILLLGSHLDTVRNAGAFDGALGVLLAIACVKQLKADKVCLPFGIEVIGFADEEGVRYQSAYLGSRALAGCFDRKFLRQKDAKGVLMAKAIGDFGGQPQDIGSARLDPKRLLGYLEAHIEQGPVLEQRDLAVGLVTAIAGQSRLRLTFSGRAAHAGTTPMRGRRDALCAAAEFILAVENQAWKTNGMVATVGQIQTEPNVSNVIPGIATVTLDVRHQQDAMREAAVARLRKMAGQAAAKRKVKLAPCVIQQTPAVPCSAELSGLLTQSIKRHQTKALALPSGAGHDAAILARITPTAMLFIRCKGGISHQPDESVKLADVQVALAVMKDFLTILAKDYKFLAAKIVQ